MTKIALVNPRWTFEGSIYFGCREPHLPVELGAMKVLLERAGHKAVMLDGALMGLDDAAMAQCVATISPDITVVTTAPTYLFWRCAQPELTVPRRFFDVLGRRGGMTVAVGPHSSATPAVVLRKLGADVVIRGEPDEAVVELADAVDPLRVAGVAARIGSDVVVTGGPRAARFSDLPALDWPGEWVERHRHHHHRFDRDPDGPGAEVEASRGCPFSCTFCAKTHFRDRYRRRESDLVLEEIDRLVAAGVTYVYFIDEIFLPDRVLLEALTERPLAFGIQTRIDLWKPDMIRLLGQAGCVSIEAGVESLSVEGRARLDKRCRLDNAELADRLVLARGVVPFVQANLIRTAEDDPAVVAGWRDAMRAAGVWANDPVPMFPYPSSPDYRARWGDPDDRAWERAHAHYLASFDSMSDIQEARPLPLDELEAACTTR